MTERITVANAAYQARICAILLTGDKSAPRNQVITEEIAGRMRYNADQPVITLKHRKLNYAFMFAEAAWLLSGCDEVDRLARYMNGIRKFSDDGIHLAGAYGPKFVVQEDYVLDALTRDSDTRQAVMTIWERNPGPSKDLPCTISVQFLIRGDLMHAVVCMRSSDVYLGVPYDMFSFAMMVHYMCARYRENTGKRVQPGHVDIMMGSSHAYDRDSDKLQECMNAEVYGQYETINPHVFISSRDIVNALWSLANADLCGIKGLDQFQPLVAQREWTTK